jgi:hypothetical protein
MLTHSSCLLFTHKKSWTPYPAADIWARLTTWKFPLLQLVAVFPRPPLTILAELFVLVHLLGDPISTTNNLLLKLASCQARALFWKDKFEKGEIRLPPPADPPLPACQIIWKGLTAIVDSYDEWGTDVGSLAESFIFENL